MRKIKENAKEIDPKKLETLKYNASLILADYRRHLLNEFPFIGSVSMSLDLVPVRDLRLPTAATDGKHIYFDIDFLSTLNQEQGHFVLAHEIWHCCLAHMLRSKGFDDHELMNIAEDLEVNQLLIAEHMTCPHDACTPQRFQVPEGLSAEEYYKLLIQQQKKNGSSGKGKGKGQSTGSGGSDDGDGDNGQSGTDDPNKSGNNNGKLAGQFDKHLTENDKVAQISQTASIADKYGKVGFDPDYNPSLSGNDLQETTEKLRESMISAAQQYERSRGTLPGYLQRLVDKISKPEIPWQEVLASFVTRVVGSDPCWNRPNRRFVHSGTYLPSHESESIRLGVVIDTSGSTAGDIPKFLGEVNGIVKTFSGYSLTIVEVDTQVGKAETFSDDNPLDLENTDYQVSGGGGTEINPGLQWFGENDCEVDAMVVFTDGYTENFTADMDPGIPVLWVLTKDGQAEGKEFGEICRFTKDATED